MITFANESIKWNSKQQQKKSLFQNLSRGVRKCAYFSSMISIMPGRWASYQHHHQQFSTHIFMNVKHMHITVENSPQHQLRAAESEMYDAFSEIEQFWIASANHWERFQVISADQIRSRSPGSRDKLWGTTNGRLCVDDGDDGSIWTKRANWKCSRPLSFFYVGTKLMLLSPSILRGTFGKCNTISFNLTELSVGCLNKLMGIGMWLSEVFHTFPKFILNIAIFF